MPEDRTLGNTRGDLSQDVRDAGAELDRVTREEILPAAKVIEDAFEQVGRSIRTNLASAAESGEFSLKRLTRTIVQNMRAIAIESLVRQPIENLLTRALTAPFGGARAGGGFVAPGQGFLVGERGPEYFQPHVSGAIQPMTGAGGGMTVNIALPGVTDAESFRRSETQLAAALARAVGRGRRNL